MDIRWYWPLLYTHITAVSLSVGLFIARMLGVQWQQAWPMARAYRRLSVTIDVVLLCAGVSLWVLMQHSPVRELWLALKLLLLPVYVVLGSFALKRAATRRARRYFGVAALAVVSGMLALAVVRPMG